MVGITLSSKWEAWELDLLTTCIRQEPTWEEIQSRFEAYGGRELTLTGLRGTASRHGLIAIADETRDEAERDNIVNGLRSTVSKLVTAKNKYLDSQESALQAVLAALPPLKPQIKLAGPKPGIDASEEVANLMLTDHQIGAKVEPSDTSGITTYSFGEYQTRLERLLARMKSIIDHQRTSKRKIRKLVIWLLGDIVEGTDIFPGQAFMVDLGMMGQVMMGSDLLAQFIAYCSRFFEEVVVVCVDGNHGRIGRRGQYRAIDNFDRFCYNFLAFRLADHKNVRVWVAEGHIAIMEQFDFTFLATHGDEFGSTNGVPAASMARVLKNYTSLTGLDIDVALHGHHSVPTTIEVNWAESIMCGSMEGGTDLSVNKMQSAACPSQTLFFVHPEHCITSVWKIKVEPKREMVSNEHGFFTPMADPTESELVLQVPKM